MKQNFYSLQTCIFITCILCLFFCTSILMAQETLNGSIEYDNKDRTYITYLPAGYDDNQSMSLVIVLHGLGDSGQGIMNGTRFNEIADTADFVAVYPDASDILFGGAAWNNGVNPFGSADDVGFIDALIDETAGTYNIDLNRVYVCGFSMGGMMSHYLACELSDRIAAIAPVAGTFAADVLDACNPERAMPVMHSHGTADETVPYDGNSFLGMSSVNETIAFWLTHNECNNTETSKEQLPDLVNDGFSVEKITYGDCEEDNIEVLLYKVENMPHGWLQPENDISTSEEIWKFFSQHSLKDSSTAIAEENEKNLLVVYPNPAKDRLFMENDGLDIIKLNLYNVIGQEVSGFSKELIVNNGTSQVSLSGLPSGWYVLNVLTEKGIFAYSFYRE